MLLFPMIRNGTVLPISKIHQFFWRRKIVCMMQLLVAHKAICIISAFILHLYYDKWGGTRACKLHDKLRQNLEIAPCSYIKNTWADWDACLVYRHTFYAWWHNYSPGLDFSTILVVSSINISFVCDRNTYMMKQVHYISH